MLSCSESEFWMYVKECAQVIACMWLLHARSRVSIHMITWQLHTELEVANKDMLLRCYIGIYSTYPYCFLSYNAFIFVSFEVQTPWTLFHIEELKEWNRNAQPRLEREWAKSLHYKKLKGMELAQSPLPGRGTDLNGWPHSATAIFMERPKAKWDFISVCARWYYDTDAKFTNATLAAPSGISTPESLNHTLIQASAVFGHTT